MTVNVCVRAYVCEFLRMCVRVCVFVYDFSCVCVRV